MAGGGGNMFSTYVKMAKHSAMTTHIGASAMRNYFRGRKAQKRADASKPPLVDKGEASFLQDIENRRNNIDTGVGYASAEREADQLTANTQANILKASGGDTGAAINGLLLAARMGGQQFNQSAVTQGAQQQNFLTNMAGGLVGKIADRKMQLQLADRAQYLAQAMQYKQQAQQQGTQLLTHMLDTDSAGLSGFGKGSGTNQGINGTSSGQGMGGSGGGGERSGGGRNIMSMIGGGGGGAGAGGGGGAAAGASMGSFGGGAEQAGGAAGMAAGR